VRRWLFQRDFKNAKKLGNQVRQLTAAVVLLSGSIAHSASAAAPVFGIAEFSRSTDSSDFSARSAALGAGFYTSTENFTDKLAYRHNELIYKGPGFSSDGSADTFLASKMFGAIKADAEITRAKVDSFGSRTLGAFQLAGQVPGTVNLEARFEKDLVESAPSLKQGITYSAYTLAADKEITPRFVLAGVAGRFNFTNDNQRDLYRLKATYVVMEDIGLSAYAKTRHYSDSRPGSTLYFSPDSFNDYLGGLRIRRRVGSLHGMFSAYVEAGRQQANGVTSPVHGWQLRMESFPNKPWHYDLAVGLQTSAEAAGGQLGVNGNYEYKYVRASMIYQFF
jgi:hypothetical protein